jgi:hypothetical protein
VIPPMPQGLPVDNYHPILDGVEIKPKSPEWSRYQQERIAAVHKVFNRPLPGSSPAPR